MYIKIWRGVSLFSQHYMIGCWGAHLMWIIIWILLPFSETFQWDFSKSIPQFLHHMPKLEAPRLWMYGIWDPTMWLQLLLISSRWSSMLSHMQFFAFYLMAQGSHESKTNPRYLYSWVISIWSLPRKPILVYFPYVVIKDQDFGLMKFDMKTWRNAKPIQLVEISL